MQRHNCWLLVLFVVIAQALAAGASNPSIATLWEAASGDFPDEIAPIPWNGTDLATPEDPVLSGGILTLSTSHDSETMSYLHSGSEVQMPSTLVVKARLRYVSGSSGNPARLPIGIHFTTAPFDGNVLWIGQDDMFLMVSNAVPGAHANVDTDGGFHDYRVEVTAGAITVYHDNVQVLTGSNSSDPGITSSVPRVGFGNSSILSHGVSEWESFEHNASPPIVTATWDDVFAIQAHGPVLHPSLLVGLSLGTAEVTSLTMNSIALTYSGLDPNSDLQINLATFVAPFYPPDPVDVVSPSRVEVEMDREGTMFTLGIDFASTTGEFLDPAAIVGFNPQPEPPAGSKYAFDPQPEPPGLGEGLGIFIPLSGGVGAPGTTQISLTLEVLDGSSSPLPLDLIAVTVPASGVRGIVILAIGLFCAGLWQVRRRPSARLL